MATIDRFIQDKYNQINPDELNFSPLPEGLYVLSPEKAEILHTKDGTGQYIRVQFDVIAPAYQGRKVWENFNIVNNNAQAESIGLQQLKQLGIACGLQTLSDTDQLLGHTVTALVTIDKKSKNSQFGEQNRVKNFKPGNQLAGSGSGPALPFDVPASTPAPNINVQDTQSNTGTQPWLNPWDPGYKPG